MTTRRRIPGLKTRPPLRDDVEYRHALAELHGLGQAALGTPATRGLQTLVDCILDYEAGLAAATYGHASNLEPHAGELPQDGLDTTGSFE
jgi:hypothetical protein